MLVVVVTALLAAPTTATAAGLNVQILDKKSRPVKDAVVTLVPMNRQDAPLPEMHEGAVLSQRNMEFSPHVLAVPKGSEVKFLNEDDLKHHVYSFSEANKFELKLFGLDETRRVRFDVPGVVILGCNIHDNMLAYIYVAETELVATTGGKGIVGFSDISPGQYRVRVWHPRMRGKAESIEQVVQVSAEPSSEIKVVISLKRPRRPRRSGEYDR